MLVGRKLPYKELLPRHDGGAMPASRLPNCVHASGARLQDYVAGSFVPTEMRLERFTDRHVGWDGRASLK